MFVGVVARGRSFKGLAAYLTKPRDGDHRALWHTAENVGSDNPETVAKIMAFTSKHADEIKAATGHRKTKNATTGEVYHAVMSWPEGVTPSQAEQLQAARDMLATAKLDKAQALIVAHNDNGKEHLHLMVNLVDPETGKRFTLSNDFHKMDAWATQYAQARGWLDKTPKRAAKAAKQAENAQRSAEGGKTKAAPEKAQRIGRRDWQKIDRAASQDWQRRKAERDAAFARQGAERAELRAAHSAEWKTAKAEAAQHKAAYKAAFRAAYAQQKAADKPANKPAWGALFKRQEAERRAAVNVANNTHIQADRARLAARDTLRAMNRAERRKVSKLGRLAQRIGLAMTPEEARAHHMRAAERLNQTAQQLAAAELAKAGLAAKHEAERKALGAQLSQATFAKAQLAVSNMPRADFAAMIERQNAERAEQIERQNAERAALGMKPYEPRTQGDKRMSPLEKMEPQAQRARADFGRAAPKPLPAQPEAERAKVQGAFRAPAPNGHKVGVTFGAPTKAAQDQAREQAKAQREQAAAMPEAQRLTPSNDRTSFSVADLKAHRREHGGKEATQKAAEQFAKTTQEQAKTRDRSRDNDFER